MSVIEITAEQAQAYIEFLTREVSILKGNIEMFRSDQSFYAERCQRLSAENDHLRDELVRLQNRVPVSEFDWTLLNGLDKIPAIKAFRDATGLGLRESKDLVERAAFDLFMPAANSVISWPFNTDKQPVYDSPFAIDASK